MITGAASGIGLATAESAANQKAAVVLAARSEQALNRVVDNPGRGRLRRGRPSVQGVASSAIEHFGRIDTWVNNAGLGMYGRLDEVSEEDNRQLFDINFWGVVNGSLVALPSVRRQGGALINLGSEVSEAYVPLLGMYTASKHAVKGFTDAPAGGN